MGLYTIPCKCNRCHYPLYIAEGPESSGILPSNRFWFRFFHNKQDTSLSRRAQMASCRITIKSLVKPLWIIFRTELPWISRPILLAYHALPGVYRITSVRGLSWDHATTSASVIFPLKWPGISSHLHMQKTNWLVVYLPLWKIWNSVGGTSPNLWKNKKNPNQQPAYTYIYISYIYWESETSDPGWPTFWFPSSAWQPRTVQTLWPGLKKQVTSWKPRMAVFGTAYPTTWRDTAIEFSNFPRTVQGPWMASAQNNHIVILHPMSVLDKIIGLPILGNHPWTRQEKGNYNHSSAMTRYPILMVITVITLYSVVKPF